MLDRLPAILQTIDAHHHLWGDAQGEFSVDEAAMLLAAADKLGIERLCVSNPETALDAVPPEVCRRRNDVIAAAMAFSPRFLGFAFIDAAFGDAAVAEIDRCIVQYGMAGIKLYHQHKIQDDIQRPLMRRAAELGVPVLMHAGKCTDPATMAAQPRLSHAADFREALAKYPETMLIQGHIGGGGDWQWNLRVLEGINSENYFIDLSGSVVDSGIVRATIDAVGVDRVLFATDGSMEEGVGKLLAAGLDEDAMRKICSGNWRKIAARRRE